MSNNKVIATSFEKDDNLHRNVVHFHPKTEIYL